MARYRSKIERWTADYFSNQGWQIGTVKGDGALLETWPLLLFKDGEVVLMACVDRKKHQKTVAKMASSRDFWRFGACFTHVAVISWEAGEGGSLREADLVAEVSILNENSGLLSISGNAPGATAAYPADPTGFDLATKRLWLCYG